MLSAVLFDLDDTLLGNSMDTFLPAYFRALEDYMDPLIPRRRLIPHLMRATEAMNARSDERITNEEAFAAAFYPALGVDRARAEPVFQRFYADVFPRLRVLTEVRPEARWLVEWAAENQLQVVVATNPLFPRVAVEQRLAWANVSVDDVDYSLVTTYENMHATKVDEAYYREVLERIEREPDECLMVGDSWEMDICPALSLGIHAYWVAEASPPPRSHPALTGHGTLRELWERVEAHDSLLLGSTS